MRGVSNKFLPTRPQAADVGGFVDGDLDSGAVSVGSSVTAEARGGRTGERGAGPGKWLGPGGVINLAA